MNKPDIRAAARHLLEDCRRTVRASNARFALPPGSSRARVTTANANWASACEQRDTSERVLESIGGAEVVPLVKEVADLERVHGKGHESTKAAVAAMRAAVKAAEGGR